MTRIDYHSVSTRLRNFLTNERIATIEQLAAYGRRPMLRFPNVGTKSAKEADELLRKHNMQFVDETWCYASVKRTHDPDGYAGRWLQDDVKDPRVVKLVNNLNSVADFVRMDSRKLAQVILDGADELVQLSKRAVKAEMSLAIALSENETRRSDGVQMWKALSSEISDKEIGLAFDAIMNARRNALKDGA